MNSTLNTVPKQLGFADWGDSRPLPLIAAEQWNFPLQHHTSDDKAVFAVQDWIVGLVGCDNISAGKMWRQFKKSESYLKHESENQSSISNVSLDYHASDGKTYQRDFADDETLYLLSQYLRPSENRPMLDEIRQFLASSGKWMDEWRINPDKMLSVAQARLQADIERYEKAGYGNHPNILQSKAKLELSIALKELKSSVSRLVTMTGKEWGQFHDAEIWALLGYTSKQIKAARNPKLSARDNLNIFESNGLKYCEQQLIALLSMQKQIDTRRLKDTVQFIFAPVGENLRGMMESIGMDVLTGQYQLPSGKN
jgi:hypothetical protein